MDAENIIKVFTTRVRQLILLVADLRKENSELSNIVDQRDNQIKELNDKIAQLTKDYDTLMTAKMLSITDDNLENTKRRINKLITTVDKCITLLGKSAKADTTDDKS